MFNCVEDSYTVINMLLCFLGGLVLTATCIFIFIRNRWDYLKKYISVIIIILFFFSPTIIGIAFLIFGLGPSVIDNFIYISKPKEYKIQIVEKESRTHKETESTSKNRIKRTPRIYHTYHIKTHKWWGEENSKEIVEFEVRDIEYDKVYKNEFDEMSKTQKIISVKDINKLNISYKYVITLIILMVTILIIYICFLFMWIEYFSKRTNLFNIYK